MKRKWLAALLTAAMTAGVLTGCGGSNAGTTDTGNTGSTEAPADNAENSEGGVQRKRLLRQTAGLNRQMRRM